MKLNLAVTQFCTPRLQITSDLTFHIIFYCLIVRIVFIYYYGRVELQLKFPYFSHDSTALCYTEGASVPNTKFRRAADQRCLWLLHWCPSARIHFQPGEGIFLKLREGSFPALVRSSTNLTPGKYWVDHRPALLVDTQTYRQSNLLIKKVL